MVRVDYFTVFTLLCHAALLSISVALIPVSWDEGWNFCSARTLIEHKFYGCLLLGEPTSPRLATGIMTVIPSAISFHLFGVSIWSGRVLIALQTLTAIILICLITRKAFGPLAAFGSATFMLLNSGDQRVHPVLLGGQAWGEMPAMLFVSVGCLSLMNIGNPSQSKISIVSAAFWFGMAQLTKLQTQPFILFGILATIVILRREGRGSFQLILLAILSYLFYRALNAIPPPYAAHSEADGSGTVGLSKALGVVLAPEVRLSAFRFALQEGWPSLFAMIGLLTSFPRIQRTFNLTWGSQTATLFLCTAALSWYGWFITLAINFPRYLAPSLFLSAPIVGASIAMLVKYSNTVRSKGPGQRLFRYIGPILVLLGILQSVKSITTASSFFQNFRESNKDLIQTARYVHEHTKANDIIETYDSQLLFLLNRPFHYPPDQIHVQAIQAQIDGTDQLFNYDPLKADPEILVIGLWSENAFPIYKELIRTNEFAAEARFGDFTVYRRVRARLQ